MGRLGKREFDKVPTKTGRLNKDKAVWTKLLQYVKNIREMMYSQKYDRIYDRI